MADVLTVREAVRRCRAEELPISEYTLRRWVKNGVIPCRRIGNKVLLYFPSLAAYLRCEAGADNPPSPVVIGGIRRVD